MIKLGTGPITRDPEVDLVTAATFLEYSQPSAEDLEEAASRLC